MSGDQAIDFAKIAYVFLDRDGVLNRKPPEGQFVTCWEEFQLLPGIEQAIAELNRSRRKVIVVSNQRGVALGLYSQLDLAQFHARLKKHLAGHRSHLDAIYVCPHDDGECSCRKPQTGLIEQAFRDFPDAHPQNSIMVGDSFRDIETGVRMGMPTVFINAGEERGSIEAKRVTVLADLTVASLPELVHRYFCG